MSRLIPAFQLPPCVSFPIRIQSTSPEIQARDPGHVSSYDPRQQLWSDDKFSRPRKMAKIAWRCCTVNRGVDLEPWISKAAAAAAAQWPSDSVVGAARIEAHARGSGPSGACYAHDRH
jgi:hypothetical protein